MKISSLFGDYSVHFEDNSEFITGLADVPGHCCVIDENVWAIYGKNLLSKLDQPGIVIQSSTEGAKNLDSVQRIYDVLVKRNEKRNMTLIAIGGGVVQDITGFVASTLYRGVNWIYVPTTLLAQADSCIGAKTSLNHRGYKNLIGTFYPPKEVFVYPSFLRSLHESDYYSGVGEIVKLHLLAGFDKYRESVGLMKGIHERNAKSLVKAIRSCLDIKRAYIENDEFDRGSRRFLNYGHCFGHAIEYVSGYRIPHGQAVLLGIVLANRIAVGRGLLRIDLSDLIYHEVLFPALKFRVEPDEVDPELIYEAMLKDKKRNGTDLTVIVLGDELRASILENVAKSEILDALRSLRELGIVVH